MSLGSLNAGPENVTPKGEGFALKPGGTGAVLGKNPPGTITLGNPARAGALAPKLAGKRTASNFFPAQLPWSATSPAHSGGTTPVYNTSRPQVLVNWRSRARSAT